MNKKTYGELLFERYLRGHGLIAQHEPSLPGSTRLIDYVMEHPTVGKILFEVKDIEPPLPPQGFSAYDPYRPIATHIKAAVRKFTDLSEYVCVIVLVKGENHLVDIQSPRVMLGSMYGRYGWTIPFDVETGKANPNDIMSGFVGQDGKMLRRGQSQNTRVAAVISLMNYDTTSSTVALYLDTDDGRTRTERFADVWNGVVNFEEDSVPCVTVWENAVAQRKLPSDLFRGEMDAWWSAGEEHQTLTFVGDRRRMLKIDERNQ